MNPFFSGTSLGRDKDLLLPIIKKSKHKFKCVVCKRYMSRKNMFVALGTDEWGCHIRCLSKAFKKLTISQAKEKKIIGV